VHRSVTITIGIGAEDLDSNAQNRFL